MWQVTVVCSDDRCAEVMEVVVYDLDEVEAVVCECDYNVVVLAVASFEPLTAAA
jgi:NADH/NAD ratio-sensing transcriptional regulator Rex